MNIMFFLRSEFFSFRRISREQNPVITVSATSASRACHKALTLCCSLSYVLASSLHMSGVMAVRARLSSSFNAACSSSFAYFSGFVLRCDYESLHTTQSERGGACCHPSHFRSVCIYHQHLLVRLHRLRLVVSRCVYPRCDCAGACSGTSKQSPTPLLLPLIDLRLS
jgi:hypothetical protein